MSARMVLERSIVMSVKHSRWMSTRSSQDYLRQWLGNDMSGETYHSRIMAAAKARYETDLLQQEQQRQSTLSDVATMNLDTSQSLRNAANQMASVPFPVICLPPMTLEEELAQIQSHFDETMAQANVDGGKFYVLDLRHLDVDSSSSSFLLSFEDALEKVLSSNMHSTVLGVVNYRGQGDYFCNLPIFPSPIILTDSGSSSSQPEPSRRSSSKDTGEGGATTIESDAAIPVAPAIVAPSRAHVHYGTVRSGQQVYAEKASLIVIGGVNDGGEVLADGDIHVYGPLKGRAVAGLGGGADGANACVFARSFGPSLVGVNEVFIAPDDHAAAKQFLDREVVVRASGAKNFSSGVGARLPSVEIDGVTISLLPLS